MSARVERIQIARHKGSERESVRTATLESDLGIRGDAYAGPGDRQVVLYAVPARFNRVSGHAQAGVCHARFRENIRVAGLDHRSLEPGTRIHAGGTTLEVSRAKKRCFPECTVSPGDCDIRLHTLFCTVVKGGSVVVGDDVSVEMA